MQDSTSTSILTSTSTSISISAQPSFLVASVKNMKHAAFLTLSCLCLAACTGNQDDLKAWVEQAKTKTVPKVPYVAPLKEYITQPYMSSALPSPFSAVRIGQNPLEAPPDGNRPREPLEMIPLEAIKFIGSIKQPNNVRGMVLIDGKIHSVKMGQYLGQDYGKIIAINDGAIKLRELVKDGSEQWNEKITELTIEDAKQ